MVEFREEEDRQQHTADWSGVMAGKDSSPEAESQRTRIRIEVHLSHDTDV